MEVQTILRSVTKFSLRHDIHDICDSSSDIPVFILPLFERKKKKGMNLEGKKGIKTNL